MDSAQDWVLVIGAVGGLVGAVFAGLLSLRQLPKAAARREEMAELLAAMKGSVVVETPAGDVGPVGNEVAVPGFKVGERDEAPPLV